MAQVKEGVYRVYTRKSYNEWLDLQGEIKLECVGRGGMFEQWKSNQETFVVSDHAFNVASHARVKEGNLVTLHPLEIEAVKAHYKMNSNIQLDEFVEGYLAFNKFLERHPSYMVGWHTAKRKHTGG